MNTVITDKCRKIIEIIINIPNEYEYVIDIDYNYEYVIDIDYNYEYVIDEFDYEYNYNHNIYYDIYREIMKQYEEYDKTIKHIPSYLFKPTNNILKNGFTKIEFLK